MTCSIMSARRSVVGDVRGVLGGNDHGVDAHGAIVVVFDGHLGLPVGTEIGERAALAHLGQAAGQTCGPGEMARGMYSSVSSQA